MEELKIEYIDPAKLKPYEKNARKHTDYDLATIKASIEEFGFKDPIGVWGKNNLIVEGHGRQKAALELGLDKVPIIRLDDLSDEQRRAYALAHNKTAEMSSWEPEMLDAEILDIESIDMSEFGFDIPEETEDNEESFAEKTQDRVENICNLGYGQYDGEGFYDIPRIKPVRKLPKIKEWIGFNYVMSDDEPDGKAVHFFIDDYQFERVWNEPERYIEKLKQYAAVASPDFSPYGDMPLALQIYNHYRKHWVAAYWQEHGITVIPTIRASTDIRSIGWYLDGEPHNGAVLISGMWTNDEASQVAFEREYNTMLEKLTPNKIFLYGKSKDGLDGNVETIDSFTKGRWGKATRNGENNG